MDHGKKYGIDEFMHAARRMMEIKPPHAWDPHTAEIHHYLAIFKAALMDFVVDGNIIYHGIQTHFLLVDVPRILRLKVVAPMEYRVKTLMMESSFTEEEAREHIMAVDVQRQSWAKFMYGPEFDEPTSYDMILNMSFLNLDAMAEVISILVRRPEFRIDGGAIKKIRDAHLRSRVLANLVKSPETRGMEVEVHCSSETGEVRIRRLTPTALISDWKEAIERALAGEELVKSLHIADTI